MASNDPAQFDALTLTAAEAQAQFDRVASAVAEYDHHNGTYYGFYLNSLPPLDLDAILLLMALPDGWRSGERPPYSLETHAATLAIELQLTIRRIQHDHPDYLREIGAVADTGHTLDLFLDYLRDYHPASLTIAGAA